MYSPHKLTAIASWSRNGWHTALDSSAACHMILSTVSYPLSCSYIELEYYVYIHSTLFSTTYYTFNFKSQNSDGCWDTGRAIRCFPFPRRRHGKKLGSRVIWSVNMAEVATLWTPDSFSQTQRQKRKKNNTSYNRLQKIISMLRVCVSYNRSHSLCLRQERKGRATSRPTHWQRAAAPTQSHSALFTKRRGNPSNSNRCFHVFRRQLTLITSLKRHVSPPWLLVKMSFPECSWTPSHIKRLLRHS